MKINALILAAGKGSRMKSNKPKVLFEILEKPMISCVYDNLKNAGVERIIPIISPDRMEVLNVLDSEIEYVYQKETKGTGHAVLQAKDKLANEDGVVVIVAGDQPLIDENEIKSLINYHITNNCDMTMLTAIIEQPNGYGRVIKDGFQVQKIVEQKDLQSHQFKINEVNISTYCFNNKLLFEMIDKIDNSNAQDEYYITDLVEIFNNNGFRVGSIPISNNNLSIGVNDQEGLTLASRISKEVTNLKHLKNGVQIIDTNTTYIGCDVIIGNDTIIYPNSIITGNTVIESNCIINGSQIKNSLIESGTSVITSFISDSKIGSNTTVGPYAHIRAKTEVSDNCRIGNFVEIKNSYLSDNVKAAHLSYLGNSDIGDNTNIGCGVITVNYDGINKHKTQIGSDCFIGSNVNLIAPIKIGNKVKIGAGSTVAIEEVDNDTLVIARSRETIKKNKEK
ncbi:MAG: bifunctional UDP-N-acetylglucosamine diphosphorylase/glucosamine-1-phosphate N-acetyltransferase GlmU [Bacilli bacterium]